MSAFELIAAIFGGISLALTLWQWAVALRFPLDRPGAGPSFTPPLTLLKPLNGADPRIEACLDSWLTQAYAGPVQVLFGVDPSDLAAAEAARRVLAAHPSRDAELVPCRESPGANGKVSKLIQLWPGVKHDLVVVSDADVWAPPGLLASLIAPLRDPRVGLVTCLYRLPPPASAAMQWEAVAVNADFWSQVLQARSLGFRAFALGAVMGVSRAALEAAGGWVAVADDLAEDYQLGRRVAQTGREVALCPVVVDCREPCRTWSEVWRHQLRWARTLRVCQPLPYFLSILGNPTPWALLGTVAWLAAGPGRSALTLGLAVAVLVGRVATALHNESRLVRRPIRPLSGWRVPMKDLLQVAVWAMAFAGDTVSWGGVEYRIGRQGRLVRR